MVDDVHGVVDSFGIADEFALGLGDGVTASAGADRRLVQGGAVSGNTGTQLVGQWSEALRGDVGGSRGDGVRKIGGHLAGGRDKAVGIGAGVDGELLDVM